MAKNAGESKETGDAMVSTDGNGSWPYSSCEFGTSSSESELLEQQVSE